MEYANLGRSGLSVSRLCLGTMNFGPLTPPAEAHAIMDHAHELGINFFDTANRYGGAFSPPGQVGQHEQAHVGWTEEIIGDWFAPAAAAASARCWRPSCTGRMGDWPNDGKLSALNIRRACDASLRRLRTDHIDLYQMHHVDRDTPWDEIWQAMEVLVTQGKILYVGSSNFAGWHIAQANDSAAARGFFGLVSEQSIYNLMTRDDRAGGAARGHRLRGRRHPVVAAAGRPARRRAAQGARGPAPPRRAGRRQAVERNREQIEAYESFCEELGEEPATVALAWLLHQDGVTAPIVGPRTLGQLDDAQRALALALDEDALNRLDAIFPGYKSAPEHYAW